AVASLPDPLYLYQLPMLQLLGEAFGKGGSMMLEIKNLTVKVKNNAPILRGVSLSIDEGTCIGLTGASGSGKTTLIKSIMGMNGGDLEVPQGQILLDGDDLLKRSAKERRGLCGKTIGFIQIGRASCRERGEHSEEDGDVRREEIRHADVRSG